jgi:AAA+ superfamily predicted ATPase
MSVEALDAVYRNVATPLGMEMIVFDRERGLRCVSFPVGQDGTSLDPNKGVVFNSHVRLGVVVGEEFHPLVPCKLYSESNFASIPTGMLNAGETQQIRMMDGTTFTDRQGVTWCELDSNRWVAETVPLPRFADPMVEVWNWMRTYLSPATGGRVLFVLNGIHPYLEGQFGDSDFGQVIKQGLLNVAEDLKLSHKRVLILGEQVTLDRSFNGMVESASLSLPSVREFATRLPLILKDLNSSFEQARLRKEFEGKHEEALALTLKVSLTPEQELTLCHKASGLSLEEFAYVIRLDATSRYRIDEQTISLIEQKQLESFRANKLDVIDLSGEDVPAGLESFKQWVADRKDLFWASVAEDRDPDEMDIPAPKGCLLLGLPGTGKSAMSKGLALLWGLPLVRLNLPAMKDSFVGQTTKNIRAALDAVEGGGTPKILWVDEIDKAAAGAASDYQGDSGTSKELIGEFLTWMQEKQSPVFVIMTANDISKLEAAHPELFRAGRLDATFFVDLPNATEREAILSLYLSKQGCKLSEKDMATLVAKTETFVGSEIEQLVKDAMIVAARNGRRKKGELHLGDLLLARETIRPIAAKMGVKVAELQSWARDNAISASLPDVSLPAKQSSRQPVAVTEPDNLLL